MKKNYSLSFCFYVICPAVFSSSAFAEEKRILKDRTDIQKYLEQQFNSKLEALPLLSSLESNGISTPLSDLSTFCASTFGEGFTLGSNGASSELSPKKDQYYYVVAKQSSDDPQNIVKMGTCGSTLQLSDFNKIVARRTLPQKKGEKPASMVLIKMHIVQRAENALALGANPIAVDSMDCTRAAGGRFSFGKTFQGTN
jgi:hypothetical protein